MSRYWIGVSSREHVRHAVDGAFFQANHGKEAPLRRIAQGDHVLFYSPREGKKTGDAVQAFTALGEVIDAAPYRAVQSATFEPFRRNVRYAKAKDAPIRPLLEALSFLRGKKSWGQMFRRGFFEIPEEDFSVIAAAMGVETTDS